MKCCVVGAGNSNGKVGASRAMGDAGTDGSAVLIENQRRIVGARSSGRRVGRQHLCCGSRSGRPGYASRAGRPGRSGRSSHASRTGRSSGPARPGRGGVKRKASAVCWKYACISPSGMCRVRKNVSPADSMDAAFAAAILYFFAQIGDSVGNDFHCVFTVTAPHSAE